jgi:mRNA interferase RelE/StbE
VPFALRYHPDVKAIDIPLLDAKLRTRIKNAIETRLTTAPHLYGGPLRKTLRGYWKLRVGDYRVVFKIVAEEVWILGIIHRKKVYEAIKKRL